MLFVYTFIYLSVYNLKLISTNECELKKVLHEFQLPGCLPKIIPTYGCQGSCSSYVQVSNSKFWELERSCTCCQDLGQNERIITIDCPNRILNELKITIKAPLGCICRQCSNVNEDLVKPQEYVEYIDNVKNEFEESVAFI